MLDLILRGGEILDGTGTPAIRADISVRGDRIVKMGRANVEPAARVLDVDGLTVAPGFIDVHSHADGLMLAARPDDSKVAQGVTTEIVGNCGFTLAPINPDFRELLISQVSAIVDARKLNWAWNSFHDYLNALDAAHPPVNVASLVGHGAVRTAAMGFENRAPRHDELERMKSYVDEAMEAGAVGLSTGLIYPPGSYAQTAEIVELARVVGKHGGLYSSHIRNEANHLIDAMEEAIHIGSEAGVPVQISHCKVAGPANWGKGKALVSTIHQARERGLDVTGDQYPYIAGSTFLSAFLPPWAHEGGVPEMVKRLRSREQRTQMQYDIEHGLAGWWNPFQTTTLDGVLMAHAPLTPEIEGMTLEMLARDADQHPIELIFDLIEQSHSQVVMVIFQMHEQDVKTIMQDSQIMIGTDSVSIGSKPHPRSYGTYPRILGRYVRQEHILPLPEAIRKMTSLPARKFGLQNRGVIREGAFADLVIFDPQRVMDTATYQMPIQHPIGIPYVLVNGSFGVDDGGVTGARTGRVLRRAKQK